MRQALKASCTRSEGQPTQDDPVIAEIGGNLCALRSWDAIRQAGRERDAHGSGEEPRAVLVQHRGGGDHLRIDARLRVSGWKNRQCRSVHSIIGAME